MERKKWQQLIWMMVMSCCSMLIGNAQPVIKTAVDKNYILIGQQFTVKVQANFPGDDFFIQWIALPDSIAHFELINKSSIDSTFTNNKLTGLTQRFTLTSFDSGKWVMPAFAINFNPVKSDSTLHFFTDTVLVNVAFSVSDTSRFLKDIKTIRQVDPVNPILYWAAALVLVLIVIIVVLWWRFSKKKAVAPLITGTSLSPIAEALEALEKLRSYELSDSRQTMLYHDQLTVIFKRYLSRKENMDYRSSTTGDILMAIRTNYPSRDILTKAGTAMRFSDAVKFAKYIPAVADSETIRQSIKQIIQSIDAPAAAVKF